MFDTIRPLPALLQVRYRDMTNVRIILIHLISKKDIRGKILHKPLMPRVKKSTQETVTPESRRPKTELDEKFLSVATQVMKAHGITSDRAISLELGRNADFINKVRRGLQSAPADAWDTLLNKYPEARNITTTNVMAQGGGQAVGTVQGDNLYAPTTLEGCQVELEQHKRDLASTRAENEQLKQQVASQAALLASQEVVIASKEEIISLLRGGYNRPN